MIIPSFVVVQLIVPEPILGQPFNLTCRAIGHVPDASDSDSISVTYQSSSGGIQNCTKLPASITFNSHKNYTYSCTVVDHATPSNMGDYFCRVKIDDDIDIIISSDVATVELDWKTIAISTGASGVAVLLIIAILSIIVWRIKIWRQRVIPPDPGGHVAAGHGPVQEQQGGGENVGLLGGDACVGIRNQQGLCDSLENKLISILAVNFNNSHALTH